MCRPPGAPGSDEPGLTVYSLALILPRRRGRGVRIPSSQGAKLQPHDPQIKRVLRVQLAMTLLLPILAWPFGASIALSVLIGAGVCLVANLAFAYWVLRGHQAPDAKALGARLYGAEIAKLGLILVLFALSFAAIEGLNPLALIAAYFAAQVLPAILASVAGAGQTPGS